MKDNWVTESILEIGEVISGGTPATNIGDYWDGEIVWVTPADLSKLNYAPLETSGRKITKLGLNNSSANLIKAGSVVMSSRAPIGYFAIPNIEFSTNQGCKSIELKTNNDSLFFYYLFKFNIDTFKNKGEGTTFAEISKKQVEKLYFTFPPLPQQKKIAKILSTCDAVIEKTEAAIAKYQSLKQGMMHDLFTRGIDIKTGKLRPKQEDAPELYKKSELGWIPKDWEAETVESYTGLLKSGLSRLLSQQDIGIPVLISGNIQNGQLDFNDMKYWYLNDPQGANTNNYVLDKGDILLCFINSIEQIGKLAIFEGFSRPCIYTTNLFRIKSKEQYDAKFLFFLLGSEVVQNEVKLITKPAVNQASFTTKDFLKIPVPLIRKNEQVEIRKKINSVDSKIKSEQSSLAKYQQLKQGLMQDLLTGKVEVVADTEEVALG